MHYQPKVRVRDGAVIEAEALVRWQRPGHGLVPPGSFLPLAESSGLIVAIGRWVLVEACRQAALWRRGGHDLVVCVNVAPRQLDEGFVTAVAQVLHRTGLPPANLRLELTESIFTGDPAVAEGWLRELHALGVRISLDDFGTGYSSLMRLLFLPVSEVKLARAFLLALDRTDDGLTLLRGVIRTVREARASGDRGRVETEEQWHLLRTLQCDVGQGYHLGRPVDATAFERAFLPALPPARSTEMAATGC